MYRSGSHGEIENYRPISVIPAVFKVIKKIVHRQLSEYLEENDLLKNCQFVFRKKRSTGLAATLFIDTIKSKINEGKIVGTVFIDLSKAFDTISHAKLLQKQSHMAWLVLKLLVSLTIYSIDAKKCNMITFCQPKRKF